MLSVAILAVVFILIAIRQVGGVRLGIWQVMLGGAALALLSGQITPAAALASINPDVMLFLFGMFTVGAALEESGYLSHLSYRLFRTARSHESLVLMVLIGAGIAAAFLMNDTLAIIGTPVALHLSSKHGLNPKVLLLALCFAVTIGSVMSPIGNPQNLLIASNTGSPVPFSAFFTALLVPTLLNLILCFLLLRMCYKDDFGTAQLDHEEEPIRDVGLASLSKVSLIIIGVMVGMKLAAALAGLGWDFKLTYIALAAALPVLALSPSRVKILRAIDWRTLVFFASMFVLMESVWESGFFQSLIGAASAGVVSSGAILAISVLMSQLISNVPLVALYMPLLIRAGVSTAGLVALAAGSTIAGNLTILGAASNVIVIQNAEKKGHTITFGEFARVGIPLTILNVLVYWLFLSFR